MNMTNAVRNAWSNASEVICKHMRALVGHCVCMGVFVIITAFSAQDGKHIIPEPEENFTPEQLLLMKTQDVKYVQMKTMMERKVCREGPVRYVGGVGLEKCGEGT